VLRTRFDLIGSRLNLGVSARRVLRVRAQLWFAAETRFTRATVRGCVVESRYAVLVNRIGQPPYNRQMNAGGEFREIGHCGGQFTVHVSTDTDGRRGAQFGLRHSRSTAAGWFAIHALRQGVPVGMIQMRGVGVPWNPAPLPDCIPVFIASDTEAKFGHRCPHCRGYWRSDAVPSLWDMTCLYCGTRTPTHDLLTDGQRKYVTEFCRLTDEAG
jgi:hypothetical protein